MGHLGAPLEKRNPSINKIGGTHKQVFFHPGNSLEPHEFHRPGTVSYFCNKPSRSFFSDYSNAGNPSCDLDEICLWSDLRNSGNLCAVDMTKWKMFKEVPECMNAQFFFKEVAFLRANAFKVFNGTG
jgi:hypothetical protein